MIGRVCYYKVIGLASLEPVMGSAKELTVVVGAPVGTSSLPKNGLLLLVEADLERASQLKEELAAEARAVVVAEVLSPEEGSPVHWNRFNDARLNGPAGLAAWIERYPNLQLVGEEQRRGRSLEGILNAWAQQQGLPDQLGLHLEVRQGDPMAAVMGLGPWLAGLQSVQLDTRKTADQWQQPLGAWLTERGLLGVVDVAGRWQRDPATTLQLSLQEKEWQLAELEEQLSTQAVCRLLAQTNYQELAAERDQLRGEREALQARVEELQGQLQTLTAQRDSLQQERDTFKAERDKLSSQRQKLNDARDALEAELNTLNIHHQELTAQRGSLHLERDSLRTERDALANQHHEKILIRSALKHGFQELRSVYENPELAMNSRSGHEEPKSKSRRLAKTIGNTQNIDKNGSHQFAASHAICHYRSNTVCTYIPKNACTNLRYSLAIANGAITGPVDFHWIHKNNGAFCASTAEIIKADYTFVILRNPFTRLVSFFLDKIAQPDDIEGIDRSRKTKRKLFPLSDEELTFRSFVSHLWSHPEILVADHHIRPQVDFLLYEEYDDWFCTERIDEAEHRIKEKAGFLLHDTRNLSGHTSFSFEPIRVKGLSDLNILQIREFLARNQRPCALALYDDSIAFKANALYASDIVLYNLKFGETGAMVEWLRLSQKYLCN